MRAQIAKWGNSAAVRLPKAVLEQVGLAEGSEVEIVVEGRSMRLSPAPSRPMLADVVAEMKRLGGPGYDYGQNDWPDAIEDWPADDEPAR